MSVSFSLYRLTSNDTGLLRALNAVFGEAFGDSATYGAAPPTDAYLAAFLAERLRHIAAERRAEVIFVQADDGDDAAIALYEKVGTRDYVLHFDIAVDDKS